MSENKEKKPIYKKWWFWLIVIIIVACIFTPTDDTNNTTENSTANEVENVSEENSDENGYLTTYKWEALEENAYQETIEETRVLAVEIDDYDGTILKTGNYKIYGDDFLTDVDLYGNSYVATHNRCYTVIVSNVYYNSFNEALADEDNTKSILWLTWADYEGKTVTLEKGDYVYINHSALDETVVWGNIYLEINE